MNWLSNFANHAFIIGNGKSRQEFDLNQLKGIAPIYGCNALYRDFMPDYLVAIDDGIISEIQQSDFPKDKFIVPPFDQRWEPASCNPNRPRSNAGMNAMIEAIRRGAMTLVCLGFDFLLVDSEKSVSNLYDGTQNYGLGTRASAHDNPNRIRYLNWLANRHPEVKFLFAFPQDQRTTMLLLAPNIQRITYDTLRSVLD